MRDRCIRNVVQHPEGAMRKTFDLCSQQQFAALSGDFNPIHMDAIAARRTIAGAPIVHGVHTLLWLLDRIAAAKPDLPPAAALKVRFTKMVYVGDCASAEIVKITPDALRARAVVGSTEVMSLLIGFGRQKQSGQMASTNAATVPKAIPSSPLDYSLEQIEGLSGAFSFATAPAEAKATFPEAARYLGATRLAALACSSALVGMAIPEFAASGPKLIVMEVGTKKDHGSYPQFKANVKAKSSLVARSADTLAYATTAARNMPPGNSARIDRPPVLAHRAHFRDT